MALSTTQPPVDTAPSTTASRRSSRLQAKKLSGTPQPLYRAAPGQTTPVASKQPQHGANAHTTSLRELAEAAVRCIAADNLLRLAQTNESHCANTTHSPSIREVEEVNRLIAAEVLSQRFVRTDENHLSYPTLPVPNASISTSGVAKKQPNKTISEKENEAAPLSQGTTDATHIATNEAPTVPSNAQRPKAKTTTAAAAIKRPRNNVLKRKADDATGANGPTSDVIKVEAEARAAKRPRNKLLVEPSERVTRSSSANAKVYVDDANTAKVPAQERESGVDGTKQVTTTTGNTAVKPSLERLARTTDSIAGSEVLDKEAAPQQISRAIVPSTAQRPRLTLTIPAQGCSAPVESTTTAIGSRQASATNNKDDFEVESALTATEVKVDAKENSSTEKESAALEIRVPAENSIKAAA
ncbi:hypothetical protein D9619_009186 [Psilocybe cf. subviscida]|uniref:Uncharacterized protein n=1 Tax=Psilocybe cf. subviscida TaxID=2480587 RepID=A0A8H5BVN2_9AGAR|nr:hypothetical protein D9619_009186 [Psilocybe cf. subviscida]